MYSKIQAEPLALTVLIPAYNESRTLPQLLDALNGISLPRPHEILLVDDGSTDNTATVAAEFPSCRVTRHPYNKGNGAAIKTGLQRARGERIVVIDADMQHDPSNIPLLLEKLKEFDLVVGVRQKGVSPRVRNLGNRVLNRLAAYLCGQSIPDLTCGFRAFHREKIARFLHLYPNGFSFPATSTMAAICAGYDVAFVPIDAYRRTKGESKIRLLKDGLRFPALALRLINMFNPLKIYIPVSIVLFAGGLGWTVRTYWLSAQMSAAAAGLFIIGVLALFMGFLADQISRLSLAGGRSQRTE